MVICLYTVFCFSNTSMIWLITPKGLRILVSLVVFCGVRVAGLSYFTEIKNASKCTEDLIDTFIIDECGFICYRK